MTLEHNYTVSEIIKYLARKKNKNETGKRQLIKLTKTRYGVRFLRSVKL